METEQTATESDKYMTAAIDFLIYAKTEFREEPERYSMLLESIRGLKEGKYDLIQTGQRLSEILRGYSQLIARFNSMPFGKEVTVVDYDREQFIRDLEESCSPDLDLSSNSTPSLDFTSNRSKVFHEQAQNHRPIQDWKSKRSKRVKNYSPTQDSTSKRIKVEHGQVQICPSTLDLSSNRNNDVHEQKQNYCLTLDSTSNKSDVNGRVQNYSLTLDWTSNRSNVKVQKKVHEKVQNYVPTISSTNSNLHGLVQNYPPTVDSTSKNSNVVNEQEENEIFTLVDAWKMECF